jgi:alpha-L-rhamnosidase
MEIRHFAININWLKKVLFFLFLSIFQFTNLANGATSRIVNLKCEHSANPTGIDMPNPRLSWNIEAEQRNWNQSAYQILVASDSSGLHRNSGDIWDSGKINSTECLYIPFSGKPLTSLHKYWWKVKVWDKNGMESNWSNSSCWTMAMLRTGDWKGHWITSDLQLSPLQKELKALPDFGMESEEEMWKLSKEIRKKTDTITYAPAVYLRKNFTSEHSVKYAVANICGLGLNELYINRIKVSNELLNPAYTDYQKRVFYQSYDITQFLQNGDNTIGVILGNGWFNLVIPHVLRYYAADYINTPRLLFQLDIFYTDGTQKTVVSDNSWKFTTDGPIRFNNILSGETYDANREMDGWNSNAFKATNWKQAITADAPAGRLEAQYLKPVTITDSVKTVGVKAIKNGYSINLEKEITGWCRIKVKGEKGRKITLKYPGADSHTLGRYQTYEYILKGEKSETFSAKFSYNGIKNVEIYGLNYKPELDDITGISVNTDFPETGKFSCSNSAFNELNAILVHTMKNYVVHIPNDPVREKAGWTQDVETAFDAYAYAFDCSEMYIKWQRDFLDIIHENGYVPPVVPGRFDGPTINGPWWGGMIVYLPWKIYTHFGDKKILEESFEAMKKYTGYLNSIDSSYVVKWGLGDWLEPGSVRPVMTPVPFTSTIGFYNTALITSKTAAILGFKEDAEQYSALAEKIKVSFNNHFFNPLTNKYAKYSQTSQLMPLYFNMTPDNKRQSVLDNLVRKIEADSNHVGTGFVGTPLILTALAELGKGEVAYKMANQRTYPGWYDMVFNHGSKIFKEDWKGGLVQMPPLGGGLGYWFYYSLAGIEPDPSAPGFKNVIIKPDFVGDLTWVKGEYQSLYGTIKSEWIRENGKLVVNIRIPANTSARIYLPTEKVTDITENGKTLINNTDFSSISSENGKTVLRAGSGNYSFSIRVYQ